MNRIKLTRLLLAIFFIVPFNSWTQEKLNDTNSLKSEQILKKDTIVIIQKANNDSIIYYYQQMLEKTNSQMSLWWNPYGIFIAMLGILFAVMAIVVAILIYWQSKGVKKQINESINKYETTLEKLIIEKNNQLKNQQENLDNLITEYQEKLKTAKNDNIEEITEFISKLEVQKENIDKEIHTYKHGGWNHKDIIENYPINYNTNFFAKITLNQISQSFIIYIRVTTSDNKKYWLGFAGRQKNEVYRTSNEYSRIQVYNTKEIIIQENIISMFKTGFPNLNVQLVQIDCIRLRGENNDLSEITFSYKII